MISPGYIFAIIILCFSFIGILDVGAHTTKLLTTRSEAVSLRYAAQDIGLDRSGEPTTDEIDMLRRVINHAGSTAHGQSTRIVRYVERDDKNLVLWEARVTGGPRDGQLVLETTDIAANEDETTGIAAVIDYQTPNFIIPLCEDICSILSD